ncbi:MAG: hypothetical protein Ct9H300mP11_32580 [Chloroflexota bacterium]|nr:MAG: hypothetical protein Ct9H300mP11_32580 [Chloroflexota bacterium]
MPGAALRAFGLPLKGVQKGEKCAKSKEANSNPGLGNMSEINLLNLSMFRDYCLDVTTALTQ